MLPSLLNAILKQYILYTIRQCAAILRGVTPPIPPLTPRENQKRLVADYSRNASNLILLQAPRSLALLGRAASGSRDVRFAHSLANASRRLASPRPRCFVRFNQIPTSQPRRVTIVPPPTVAQGVLTLKRAWLSSTRHSCSGVSAQTPLRLGNKVKDF